MRQSEGGTPLIIQSNPHCILPAGQAGVGGRRGRQAAAVVAAAVLVELGGVCCWMLLSHIPLTQVGDPKPAGRAPGQSGEGESHQSEFLSWFFQAPLGVLWNAAVLWL